MNIYRHNDGPASARVTFPRRNKPPKTVKCPVCDAPVALTDTECSRCGTPFTEGAFDSQR